MRVRAIAFVLMAASALVLAACSSAATTQAPLVGAPSAVAPTASLAPSAAASDTPGPSDSGPGDSGSEAIPDSPVAGVVTAVDSAGLDQVKGFTLLTNDGETIQFTLGQLENGDEFPPGHLKEHQTTAAPVLVFFRQVGSQLVVYRIEDAG